MPIICFYFQLHQPYRLSAFPVSLLGKKEDYFSDEKRVNQLIFEKVATKSYLPMLALLLQLVKRHPEFVFSISTSGVFLEQAQEYMPEVISLLVQLVESGQVELLAETYYHSLAGLYSPTEFKEQVQLHAQLLDTLFSYKPTVFRNTELIYSNDLAELVAQAGYQAMLSEAVPRHLAGRAKTQLYQSASSAALPLLLKHAELSDDIAFRFTDQNWPHYPLYSQTYVKWLQQYHHDELINLFMDFETFGEHQWRESGIFTFFEQVVTESVTHNQARFITPTQVLESFRGPYPVYDVPEPISWADIDRDLTAWLGNELQTDSIAKLYALEKKVLKTADIKLLQDWRKLQTSDHFYYMCTKWAADGDVHAYFNPYHSPLEAYRLYGIALADLMMRLEDYDLI